MVLLKTSWTKKHGKQPLEYRIMPYLDPSTNTCGGSCKNKNLPRLWKKKQDLPEKASTTENRMLLMDDASRCVLIHSFLNEHQAATQEKHPRFPCFQVPSCDTREILWAPSPMSFFQSSSWEYPEAAMHSQKKARRQRFTEALWTSTPISYCIVKKGEMFSQRFNRSSKWVKR